MMNRMITLTVSPAFKSESLSTIGPRVPRRGNRVSRQIGRGIMALLGWRIEGEVPNEPKLLLIGAPHTSGWDYVLTILTMMALNGDLHYVVKHSHFNNPLGGVFRWLGGVSLDRSSTEGFVEQIVEEYESREQFALAIMPEGTRSEAAIWRSGFYYIALQAQVPIMLVAFDYGCKIMRLGSAMKPTGDYEADLPIYQAYYENIQGKNQIKRPII